MTLSGPRQALPEGLTQCSGTSLTLRWYERSSNKEKQSSLRTIDWWLIWVVWQMPMKSSWFPMLFLGNELKSSASHFGTAMEILPNVWSSEISGLMKAENLEGVPRSRCLGSNLSLWGTIGQTQYKEQDVPFLCGISCKCVFSEHGHLTSGFKFSRDTLTQYGRFCG